MRRLTVDPVTEADDLLRRLDEWDQMNVTAPGADGPYWKREIARVRGLLSKDVDRRGETDVDALRAALRFYAEHSTYEESAPVGGGFDGVVPIHDDLGAKARAALAPTPDGGCRR